MTRSGALQAAAGDGAEADHAGAEHDAGRARLDLGGEHRGAEPGGEPAGEQAGAVQRGVGRDLGERDLRHHRVLRERARAHEVADRLAVARQPGRAVGQVALVLLLADGQAEVRARAQAVLALAALGREERDHRVADRDVLDALADRLDDPGALVAEHGGRVAGRVGAGGGVEVGVADAAGHEPHQHLARLGVGELDLLHVQRLAELLQHGGAHPHPASPLSRSRTRSPAGPIVNPNRRTILNAPIASLRCEKVH